MRRLARSLTVAALSVVSALGAVQGTLINQTTGQPQPGVEVSLIHPGSEGMQTLGSVKSDAQGNFNIDKELPSPPALLQADYQGVTYNLFLQPGAPSTGLRFPVYETTKNDSAATIAQHMILLEPVSNTLRVTEVFQVQNGGNTTFDDPAKGSVQFYLPKYAQKTASLSVQGPGGMPINRSPEKTSATDVYKATYPVKPGETTYEITYSIPATSKFSGKAFGNAPARLVTGPTVTLSGGEDLKSLGQEPRTQAHIYEVAAKPAGTSFEVSIQGTGAIKTDADSDQPQEDTGEPQPKAGPARVYQQLPWVLGLSFGILGLGGVLLFRRGAA